MTPQAPFPAFGGKRTIAAEVWTRLGHPTQYIEPFCLSAAVLLAAPAPASLEVVNDINGFIANFWRAVKHQPEAVAGWADYPVSHIDLGAAHIWLMAQRDRIGAALHDIEWPGDAKVAGRWLYGQCCWIGSGWCEWNGNPPNGMGKIPAVSQDAGFGINAVGKVPNVNAGFGGGVGINAVGKVPHASDAGMGVQAAGKVPHASNAGMGEPILWTSAGRTAWRWLHQLADRLERVRVVHGDWTRCLNNHYGGNDTAVFLDPPYRSYEKLYGDGAPVADAVEAWARDHAHLRIALCGHVGDYNLLGWDAVEWSRGKHTYSGNNTTDKECIWYSSACLPRRQPDLFSSPIADPEDARVAEFFGEAAA